MRLDREAVATWLEEVTFTDPWPDLVVSPNTEDLLWHGVGSSLFSSPSLDEHDPGCYLFFVDTSEDRTHRRERSRV